MARARCDRRSRRQRRYARSWCRRSGVELDDAALALGSGNAGGSTAVLRDGYRKQRFTSLANPGAFDDQAQAVETQVWAGDVRQHRAIARGVAGYVLLEPGQGLCSCRLGNAAAVLVYVANGPPGPRRLSTCSVASTSCWRSRIVRALRVLLHNTRQPEVPSSDASAAACCLS